MFPPGFGEIAERLRRSTVHIASGARGNGSGIIVKSEGTIVTNAHVVRSPRLAVTLWDGRAFPAEVEVRDVRRDLAILRITESGLPAAHLADSDRVRPGEVVMAIGNPLGFIGAVTAGIIHAIGPLPGFGARKWIQAGVRLAPGNSGGPVADARGNVVGVSTMLAGGLGLAVPSNDVTRLLNGARPLELGVTLRPVALFSAGREHLGLFILEIVPGSASSRASLLPGDVLIGVEGRAFTSIEDLETALESPLNAVLRLQFVRGDPRKIRTVTVQLRMSDPVAA